MASLAAAVTVRCTCKSTAPPSVTAHSTRLQSSSAAAWRVSAATSPSVAAPISSSASVPEMLPSGPTVARTPGTQPASRSRGDPFTAEMLTAPISSTVAAPPQSGASSVCTRTPMPALPGSMPAASKRSSASRVNIADHTLRSALGTSSWRSSGNEAKAPAQVPSPSSALEERAMSGSASSAAASAISAASVPSSSLRSSTIRAAPEPRRANSSAARRSGSAEAASVTTKPSSAGNPARLARARFAALAPTRGTSSASGSSSRTTRGLIGCRVAPGSVACSADGDDLRGGRGDHLDAGVVDDQHLLEAHPELVQLAVLGLEGEDHAGLDFHGVVE